MEETLDVLILGKMGAEVSRLLALPDCELIPELKKKENMELAKMGQSSAELCRKPIAHANMCAKCEALRVSSYNK